METTYISDMLHRIRGTVVHIAPHQIFLEVEAFTLAVRVPLPVGQALRVGQEASLYTFLSFPREEGEAILYGFLSEQERRLFIQLLKVRQLGAQRALAILSHFPTEVLLQLIHSGNASALAEVKGIGKKLAHQIILDLQPLLKSLSPQTLPSAYNEAYEALIALGFTPQEAHARIQHAFQSAPDGTAEHLVRLALQSS